MAVIIGFVIILSLLLQDSLSLPISINVKTVQLTESVPESGLTESKPVLNLENNLRVKEENKLVQTFMKAFESFEADHGKRIKRNNIKPLVLCPGDTFQYGTQCLTKQEYEENGLDGSDDYEAGR